MTTTTRREHLDDRDVGISPAAASALSPFLAEPETTPARHFVLSKSTRSACGIDGIFPDTTVGTTSEDAVTCVDCIKLVADRQGREDQRALARVRTNPVLVSKMPSRVRHRLVSAGLVKVVGAHIVALAEPKKTEAA